MSSAGSSPLLRRAAELLPFAAFVALVALFTARHHEPWRDEVGAMLEARAVPWSDFLHAMRIEGIPPLYHALLKVLGLALPNQAALITAGILGTSTLLLGTRRLIESISGSRRAAAWLTALFALTYTYAYELGVMIRQYTLGLGLALLCLSHLHDSLKTGERRKPWLATLTGALAALTSAHSACLAGGALLSYALCSLAARRKFAALWPILLTLPCFALVVFHALPFAGRTAEANHSLHHPPTIAARLALQALIEGIMPSDWWRAESFFPLRFTRPFAALRSLAFWSIVSGSTIAILTRTATFRHRRLPPFAALAILLSWPPLLIIIVQHYWGFYRHHLFLGVPALIVLAAWSATPHQGNHLTTFARRTTLVAMTPWLILQALLGAGNLLLDHRFPFSDTRSAAAALPRGAHVIGADEWRSAGMLFHRPDLHYRSPAGKGRPYRYTRPDPTWHQKVPLPPLLEEECTTTPQLTFFAGPASDLGPHAPCATPLDYPRTPFADHPFTWESFPLHQIDCTCVKSPPPHPPSAD